MSKIASARRVSCVREGCDGNGSTATDSSTSPEAGDGTHWGGGLAPAREEHRVSRLDHMLVKRWHEEPVEELTPLLGRQLIHTETMTIGRIVLSAGAVVPSHHHVHEQVANVLEGRLRFVIGGEEQIVSAGESVFIPSEVPHSVEAIEDSVVLDVFSPVRDDWVRGDDAYLRGGSD